MKRVPLKRSATNGMAALVHLMRAILIWVSGLEHAGPQQQPVELRLTS